jgi:putative membrane protein
MIERRLALATLGAFIALPALARAQSSDAASPEMKYIQDTLALGSLALAASQQALQKASHPKVKEFAQFEVAEQETMADVLKSLKSGQPERQVKAPSEAEVKQNLTPPASQQVNKLQSVQSGQDFDVAYIQDQADGHGVLLKLQEEYLRVGKEAGAMNIAKLARVQIKEHLQLLQDIKRDLAQTTAQGSAH